ncbi:MAG: SDR family NAD(P)-dependent oxidoreductase [Candidatus Marinimicrobia bacterium]|nr:SDR family NAD(P)-dependent oxidoreductase [Candidatus Neomarinimicrobiota bacterium]
MKKKINVLNGKQYAIVTGASQGLGKSFAYEAAKRGWNLILCALPGSGLPQVTEDIKQHFLCDVIGMECDLVNKEERDNFIKEVITKDLVVTMLVNNAGIGGAIPFMESEYERWSRTIDLNVQTLSHLSYEFASLLKKNAPSYMINVSSLSSFYPMPNFAVYSSTKAYNLHFTLALREELRKDRITVSSLCPGGIYTNIRVIQDVENQGLGGRLSAFYPDFIAKKAIEGVLKNKAIIIPGWFNRFLQFAGTIPSKPLTAKLTGNRWAKARAKKMEDTQYIPDIPGLPTGV